MALVNYILDIQGFPQERILFKDIMPLLITQKPEKSAWKS